MTDWLPVDRESIRRLLVPLPSQMLERIHEVSGAILEDRGMMLCAPNEDASPVPIEDPGEAESREGQHTAWEILG